MSKTVFWSLLLGMGGMLGGLCIILLALRTGALLIEIDERNMTLSNVAIWITIATFEILVGGLAWWMREKRVICTSFFRFFLIAPIAVSIVGRIDPVVSLFLLQLIGALVMYQTLVITYYRYRK